MGWYSQGTQVIDFTENRDGTLDFKEAGWFIPANANQWVSAVFKSSRTPTARTPTGARPATSASARRAGTRSTSTRSRCRRRRSREVAERPRARQDACHDRTANSPCGSRPPRRRARSASSCCRSTASRAVRPHRERREIAGWPQDSVRDGSKLGKSTLEVMARRSSAWRTTTASRAHEALRHLLDATASPFRLFVLTIIEPDGVVQRLWRPTRRSSRGSTRSSTRKSAGAADGTAAERDDILSMLLPAHDRRAASRRADDAARGRSRHDGDGARMGGGAARAPAGRARPAGGRRRLPRRGREGDAPPAARRPRSCSATWRSRSSRGPAAAGGRGGRAVHPPDAPPRRVYPEPERFRPERSSSAPRDLHVDPFGGGTRRCLGGAFATSREDRAAHLAVGAPLATISGRGCAAARSPWYRAWCSSALAAQATRRRAVAGTAAPRPLPVGLGVEAARRRRYSKVKPGHMIELRRCGRCTSCRSRRVPDGPREPLLELLVVGGLGPPGAPRTRPRRARASCAARPVASATVTRACRRSSVAQVQVGAVEEEEVGEARDRGAEVRLRAPVPDLRERAPVAPVDPPRDRQLGWREARREDQRVDLVLHPVPVDDRALADSSMPSYEVDVRRLERGIPPFEKTSRLQPSWKPGVSRSPQPRVGTSRRSLSFAISTPAGFEIAPVARHPGGERARERVDDARESCWSAGRRRYSLAHPRASLRGPCAAPPTAACAGRAWSLPTRGWMAGTTCTADAPVPIRPRACRPGRRRGPTAPCGRRCPRSSPGRVSRAGRLAEEPWRGHEHARGDRPPARSRAPSAARRPPRWRRAARRPAACAAGRR